MIVSGVKFEWASSVRMNLESVRTPAGRFHDHGLLDLACERAIALAR